MWEEVTIFPNRLKEIIKAVHNNIYGAFQTQHRWSITTYSLWAQCWHIWLALLHVRGSGVSLSAIAQEIVKCKRNLIMEILFAYHS